MTFDPTKPCATREGSSARVICTDAISKQPLIALVFSRDKETARWYYSDGSWDIDRAPSPFDLVNIPEKVTRWLNIYPDGRVNVHYSKGKADYAAGADRVACVEVTYDKP